MLLDSRQLPQDICAPVRVCSQHSMMDSHKLRQGVLSIFGGHWANQSCPHVSVMSFAPTRSARLTHSLLHA